MRNAHRTVSTCSACRTTKPRAEFPQYRSGAKAGRIKSSRCLACEAKRHRIRDPKRFDGLRQRTALARMLILAALTCCADCPVTDPIVLEFDHRDPKAKEFDVSRAAGRVSIERLKREIAKCDVVCANCHRRRTAKRFGSWRTERKSP